MRHNTLTRGLSILLALVLVLGLIVTPAPVKAEENVDSYIADLIAYYKNYQEDAETDILRTLEEMALVDPVQAEAWTDIMAYWSYVNTDMVVNIGTVPENLPEDNSVAIVILGFALNDDGTMKDELIGRLQTGLDIAGAYPESYVVVTGGGTAKNNPDVTEGGLMGEWLLEQGLSEDRLIIENQAPNTVGNAENTYKILSEQYPQVKSLVMVTSDYHVPRGCILFYSKCLLAAYESGGEALEMISNAGFYTGSNGYESISLQASGVSSVAGVKASSSVELSQLTQLYIVREADGISVTAIYHNDYERDVTEKAVISEDEAGNATVSYTENDVTLTATLAADQNEVTHFSTAHLEALIAEAEAISPAAYTKDSYAAMETVLLEAKEVLLKEDLTYHDVELAYAALSEAIANLQTLVNVAYKMPVTANCNESNAYKVNDGTISTANYWASQNGTTNVPSNEAELIIDLDGLYNVEAIRVYPYWGGQRIYKYELFGSADGESWEKIGENVSDDYATSDGFTHEIDATISHVKLVGIETTVVGRGDINNIHIIELQVFGVEADNIALNKPIWSSGSDQSAASSSGAVEKKANDGDRTTYWDAGLYANEPWAIIDLQGEYLLDEVNVVTYWMRTDNRYYHYDLYASTDGETFTKIGAKDWDTPETALGETFDLRGQDIRATHLKIVGLYDSANTSFHVNEIRAYGSEVETNVFAADEAAFLTIESNTEFEGKFTPDQTGFYNVEYADTLSIHVCTQNSEEVPYCNNSPGTGYNDYTFFAQAGQEYEIAVFNWADTTIETEFMLWTVPEIQLDTPTQYSFSESTFMLFAFTAPKDGHYMLAGDEWASIHDSAMGYIPCEYLSSELGLSTVCSLKAGETYLIRVDHFVLDDSAYTLTISESTKSESVVIASGWSGYTTWKLTDDGVLTFSPSGQTMENGECNLKNYWKVNGVLTLPWSDYANQITKVVIEDGIHDLGQMAFYELPNLTTVDLGKDVIEVRNYTFKNCTSLTTINLENVKFIREGAFYGCTSLTDVTLASDVTIEDWAFTKTGVKP